MIFFGGLWALNVSAALILGVQAEAESSTGDLGGRVPWQHHSSEDLHGGQWSEQPLDIVKSPKCITVRWRKTEGKRQTPRVIRRQFIECES